MPLPFELVGERTIREWAPVQRSPSVLLVQLLAASFWTSYRPYTDDIKLDARMGSRVKVQKIDSTPMLSMIAR